MEAATEKKAVNVTPAKARKIKTVAVLGAGVMGSRIAMHYANIGLKVFLLDIVTPGLSEATSWLLHLKATHRRYITRSL